MLSGLITSPLNSIEPESGSIKRMINRSKVDFPQPLGPISTVVLLHSTERFVGCNATASAERLLTLTSRTSALIAREWAGNRACKFQVCKHARAQTGLSASRCCYKIENSEQTRIISPHANKLESRLAGERRELFRRIFVGELGDDLFASAKMKLLFVEMNKLINLADEIHFDSPGV